MNRTQARAAAMKLVYEWEMGGDGGDDTCRELLEIKPGEDEAEYMQMVFEGVRDNQAALDEKIERFAHGWKLDRLSKVDLAILRVAAYELAQGKVTVKSLRDGEGQQVQQALADVALWAGSLKSAV